MRRLAVLAVMLCVTAAPAATAEEPAAPAATGAEDAAAPATGAPAAVAAGGDKEGQPLFDLSKTAGMEHYTGPEAGRNLLARQGLLVSPEERPQLFAFYGSNPLPRFVTTDTALHAYGVIFEDGFKEIEKRQVGRLRELHVELWKRLADPVWDEPRCAAVAVPRLAAATMVAVAARLDYPEWQPRTPEGKALLARIAADVEAELARAGARGVAASPLFGRKVDYSLLEPRSFYVGDPMLEAYFRSRAFWAVGMNLDDDAVLRTAVLLGALTDCWAYEQATRPYGKLIGDDNLPSATRVLEALGLRFGLGANLPDHEELMGFFAEKDLTEMRKRLRETLARPLVPQGSTQQELEAEARAPGPQRPLRAAVWPYALVPDAAMMARCVWPHVPELRRPGGLDVMACCGSDRALELVLRAEPEANRDPLRRIILDTRQKRFRLLDSACLSGATPDEFWADRKAEGPVEFRIDREDEAPADAPPPNARDSEPIPTYDLSDVRTSAVWAGLDKIFHALGNPGLSERHPKFMATAAYADKSLNTALCGWVAYRHTFAAHAANLYYLGGAYAPPPGYVEPNLPFWDTMAELAIHTDLWLRRQESNQPRMLELALLCIRARRIAAIQLAGEPITEGDKTWFAEFGERLARLCGIETNDLDIKIESGVVTDVATDRLTGRVLHVGKARPRAIYVVVDYGGRLQLARGGVMSYREFSLPLAEGRLTDGAWREMLAAGTDPPPPAWLEALGAGYDEEGMIAAVGQGRFDLEALARHATPKVIGALMDRAVRENEERVRDTWPLDRADVTLWELMRRRPDVMDEALVRRYMALNEKLYWSLDALPPKAEWLDIYIARCDKWLADIASGEALGGTEDDLGDLFTVIAGTPSDKGHRWLLARCKDAACPARAEAIAALGRSGGALLGDDVRADLTDLLAARIAEGLVAPGENHTEQARETLLAAECLSLLWPYWTMKEGGNYDLADEVPDKPVEYSAAQQAARGRAVAAMKRFAERAAREPEVNYRCLEAVARCLGPEAAKTPLAEKIKADYFTRLYLGPPDEETELPEEGD